jgi:uncharacterized protein YecT (DUF1311 family)
MEEYNPKDRIAIPVIAIIAQIVLLIYFIISTALKEDKNKEQKTQTYSTERAAPEEDNYKATTKKAAEKTRAAPADGGSDGIGDMLGGLMGDGIAAPEEDGKTIKPSFDCDKASTPSEKTICSDADLAELDNLLAKAYSKARSSACKKDLLKQQREWLNETSSCSSNVQCLKNSYKQRIQELEKCR